MDTKVEERVKEQELSQNTKITHEMAAQAAKMIHQGKKRQEVTTFLNTKSLNDVEAKDLIDALAKALRIQYRGAIKSGILWTTGGGIVTLATFLWASSKPNGGTYLVALGAVIFGLLDIGRGLLGMAKMKNY